MQIPNEMYNRGRKTTFPTYMIYMRISESDTETHNPVCTGPIKNLQLFLLITWLIYSFILQFASRTPGLCCLVLSMMQLAARLESLSTCC